MTFLVDISSLYEQNLTKFDMHPKNTLHIPSFVKLGLCLDRYRKKAVNSKQLKINKYMERKMHLGMVTSAKFCRQTRSTVYCKQCSDA